MTKLDPAVGGRIRVARAAAGRADTGEPARQPKGPAVFRQIC